jgi:hypothetical protein
MAACGASVAGCGDGLSYGPMNMPGLWWRLRAFIGNTVPGFGWLRPRSMVYLTSYPPGPWLQRLAEVFKPPPPPPISEHPGPPRWVMPPDDELGVAVPIREILASDPGIVIALVDCIAYSTGFEFGIALRSRTDIEPSQMGFGPPSRTTFSDMAFQVGIRFADGGTAVTNGDPSQEVLAHWRMHAEGREPNPSDGPIISPRSGGGGGGRYDFRYWVWPLPPEGKLAFTCEWPAQGLALRSREVDASAIRRAGAAATKLWSDV